MRNVLLFILAKRCFHRLHSPRSRALADAPLKAAHQAGYQRLIVRSRKAADYAESAAGEEGKKKGPELAAATLPVLEFPAPAV